MAVSCLLFVFLCLNIFVNSEVNTDNVVNSFDGHKAEIDAVLDYLKSAPVKVYNYKQGILINAHTKADITELTLDVSVDCINNYPELPCTEKILICNAFVRNNPEGGSRVLNDVKCVPKPEIIIEEAPYISSTNPTEIQNNEPKSIALSNEAVSSEVGEHFVAIRKDSLPCLGCPFDLSPSAEGVNELIDTVLSHIETEKDKKQSLIKVLRLQQQVVNGVKLILLAEIASTTCSKDLKTSQEYCSPDSETPSSICEITFLQKPWISKAKHIISNNCTISQEYVKPDLKKNDMNNEIDINAGINKPAFVDNPNFDHIAENGAADDMTPTRLENLESQIVVETDDVTNLPHQVPSTAQPMLTALENQPMEGTPNIYKMEQKKIETSLSPTQTSIETTPLIVSHDSSKSEESISSKPSSEENSSEEKPRKKRAIPQLEKISPEEKGLVKNLADFAAASLDNIDDDNQKRIILQILGAKKMVGDDGVYYRLIMRMGISHCLEDSPPEPNVNCREKLYENYTKICKVQVFVNDEVTSPKVVKSQCQNIKRDNNSNRTNYSRFKREDVERTASKQKVLGDASELNSFTGVRPGGQYEISKDDEYIGKYLDGALERLDSQSEHENKLKILEVISATKQIVEGHIYRIKAKIVLSDCKKKVTTGSGECGSLQGAEPKVCDFVIWERLWIPNSRQTNVTCEGDERQYFFRSKRSTKGFLAADETRLYFVMFNDFLKKYNKTYSSKKEYKHRLKVFSDNMEYVKLLNTYEQGTATYGVTQFADITRREFSKSLGFRPDLRNENEAPFARAETPEVELPTEFDWRKKGVVTEVKNQEQCGSCWAFSVTGNVEGQYAIKHGKLLEFSEQELVDCDSEDQGCNGGLMDNAYRAIEKLGGLETEQDYPYDAEDEKCHFKKSLAKVQLTGAVNISHDETEMAKWLVANGPISIAINANAMQFYMGGVSHPFRFLCNPNNLDHGVLIVGYGVHTYPLFKKTLPYWIVKNSWGKSWGEQGYYRVYRGDGTCGLNQTPSSAIVA